MGRGGGGRGRGRLLVAMNISLIPAKARANPLTGLPPFPGGPTGLASPPPRRLIATAHIHCPPPPLQYSPYPQGPQFSPPPPLPPPPHAHHHTAALHFTPINSPPPPHHFTPSPAATVKCTSMHTRRRANRKKGQGHPRLPFDCSLKSPSFKGHYDAFFHPLPPSPLNSHTLHNPIQPPQSPNMGRSQVSQVDLYAHGPGIAQMSGCYEGRGGVDGGV